MSSSLNTAPDASAAAVAVDYLETDQLDFMSTKDIVRVINLLDKEIRVLKEQLRRDNLELENIKDKIKEVQEKTIKLNKQLP